MKISLRTKLVAGVFGFSMLGNVAALADCPSNFDSQIFTQGSVNVSVDDIITINNKRWKIVKVISAWSSPMEIGPVSMSYVTTENKKGCCYPINTFNSQSKTGNGYLKIIEE